MTSWAQSKSQSLPGLQRHMKSHWPFTVTGYSSLTPYPASLTQQLNFWNLIHAQACYAACTHHLLKDQASECYFDGNAVILVHLNIYILLPYVPHVCLWKVTFSRTSKTSINFHYAIRGSTTPGLTRFAGKLPYSFSTHLSVMLPFSRKCTAIFIRK